MVEFQDYDGGKYAVVGAPGASAVVTLIIEDNPGYGWLKCPTTRGAVLVWTPGVRQWTFKGHF